MASDASMLGVKIVGFNPETAGVPLNQLAGIVQRQAMVVAMKEIFGWLLMAAIASLIVILLSYSVKRPFAIFPKWSSIRRAVRHLVRTVSRQPELQN